jgi:Flp pilus assembly protein TadD
MKTPLLRSALLVILVLAAYLPVFNAGFIWDDEAYVINNWTLRTPAGLDAIWTRPAATPQYYPLVHTTFWLEYQAWGLNPAGYHAVNVALHSANAVLLFLFLAGLGVPGAWWCAAIFAVHPVHVESVAWITERKNVLSGFFYLASALAWMRFAGLDAQPARRTYGGYLLALGLFIAALLSKTVTCSLPAALLLVTWWKRGRLTGPDIALMLPFFAFGLVAGLGTAWLERVHTGAEGPDWAFSFVERCLIAGRAACFYLAKLLWPHPLMFMYPRWTIDASSAVQGLFPTLAVGALAVAWLLRNRVGRGAFTALAYFVGTLFPALGFFNVYPMRYSFVADHFQYLASIGILTGIVALVVARAPRRPASWAAAVATAVLAGLAWQHSQVFRDAETLWRDTLAKNPSSWMAHNNLGILYQQRGRLEDALRHYESAVALKSDAAESLTNIGMIFAARGDADSALAFHRRAVAADPRSAVARNNLGMALAQRGLLDEGMEHLRVSASLRPSDPATRGNMANVYLLQGDLRAAANEFRATLKLDPARVDAANNLAWILATAADRSLRSPSEAVALAETVVAVPGSRTAGNLDTLAAAYAAAGRFADALRVLDEAERLARGSGDEGSLPAMQERRKLYASGKPYVWTGR